MSAMKVASDEPQGTISIEVPQHALQKIRNQLVQSVDIRNVRGISQFFGLGRSEEATWRPPSRACVALLTNLYIMCIYR
jgi:hypothetical protein